MIRDSGVEVASVVPSLLSWPGSAIVHDIKGENWQLTARFRSRHGRVLLFDPTNPKSSAYNPLLEVRRVDVERQDIAGPRGAGDAAILGSRFDALAVDFEQDRPAFDAAVAESARTSTSPFPGSGSGCSSITISLSRIVAARTGAAYPPRNGTSVRCARNGRGSKDGWE